ASQTHDVAVQTDTIAKLVVSNANEKEFNGKSSVKAKDMGNIKSTHTPNKIVPSKPTKKPTIKPVVSKPVVSSVNNSNDEWASF
ncbi:MAG: chemotaxis protein, partial [Campylobacterota bacterium]|nr:chemotaxis protein [Campylobacterota bacterium]